MTENSTTTNVLITTHNEPLTTANIDGTNPALVYLAGLRSDNSRRNMRRYLA